jgi:hypothetical protein
MFTELVSDVMKMAIATRGGAVSGRSFITTAAPIHAARIQVIV